GARPAHGDVLGGQRHPPAVGGAGRPDGDRRRVGGDGRLVGRAGVRVQEDHEDGGEQALLTGTAARWTGVVLSPRGSGGRPRTRVPARARDTWPSKFGQLGPTTDRDDPA